MRKRGLYSGVSIKSTLESFGIPVQGSSFSFGALDGEILGDDLRINFGENPIIITLRSPSSTQDLMLLFTHAVAAATVYVGKSSKNAQFEYYDGILTYNGEMVSDPGTEKIKDYIRTQSTFEIQGFGYEYEAEIYNRNYLLRIHPMAATKASLMVVEIDSFGKQYVYNVYKG